MSPYRRSVGPISNLAVDIVSMLLLLLLPLFSLHYMQLAGVLEERDSHLIRIWHSHILSSSKEEMMKKEDGGSGGGLIQVFFLCVGGCRRLCFLLSSFRVSFGCFHPKYGRRGITSLNLYRIRQCVCVCTCGLLLRRDAVCGILVSSLLFDDDV